MRFFPSPHQRLFLRTYLWRNSRPTSTVGWLVFGAILAGAGLITAAAYDLVLGMLLGGMGLVVFLSNWVFALVFGELHLQRAVYTRVRDFLNAVTHAAYPYDHTSFPMQVYHLVEGENGALGVNTEDPWWGDPTQANAKVKSNYTPLTYPAPAWVSQAVDTLTLVEGLRVLPTTSRFTTFADRQLPKPTMHQLFALRAAVLAQTPPGITPVWS